MQLQDRISKVAIWPWRLNSRTWFVMFASLLGLGTGLVWLSGYWTKTYSPVALQTSHEVSQASTPQAKNPADKKDFVVLSDEQQRSIGLKTERVSYGTSPRVSMAPGRIAPNELQYAFITPRAAGVVRAVTANVGQEVKAGELLATIDSPIVGEARLDLYTKLQSHEIASSRAAWEQTIYANTVEILAHLKKDETPDQVNEALRDRPVGSNREKLMTAYAEYRLARATLERNKDLFTQNAISRKDYDQIHARYEVAQSIHQGLMDEMGYQVKLENTQAQQTMRQTETAVRAAQERLRILGVNPDGTESEIDRGNILSAKTAGSNVTLVAPVTLDPASPETQSPSQIDSQKLNIKPVEPGPLALLKLSDTPVSTYSISAPFAGTILDRELIVPGVAVDTTHRIFTMANLETVWVEANVHEGDFEILDRIRKRGGKIRFRTPGYPGHIFEGEVIYTGDLVEEQSRSVKLLAKADNSERLLRPGMFVDVEVLSPRLKEVAQIPATALFTEGSRHYVYVKNGPVQFSRREVDSEAPSGNVVTIKSGLAAGDEVVIEGGYKLKAIAVQVAG